MSENFTLHPTNVYAAVDTPASVYLDMEAAEARINDLIEAGYPEDSLEMRLAVARARVVMRSADEITEDRRRRGWNV